MTDPLLTELRALEEALLRSDLRKDSTQLDAILHSDFIEVGRSGRRYDKSEIMRFLLEEQPGQPMQASEFELRRLAEDCALLSYVSMKVDGSESELSYTRRSSIWKRMSAGWQLIFHQGTATDLSE